MRVGDRKQGIYNCYSLMDEYFTGVSSALFVFL